MKFDGFRLMPWRHHDRVRLFTRGGHDWSERYPAIATALRSLKVKSCFIDGEVVVCAPGLVLSEALQGDGELVFRHACKLGLEGIVSKRRNSPYKSGTSLNWLKFKNPLGAAALREAAEDWTK